MATTMQQTTMAHKTVDDYIRAQPAMVRASLERLRQTIKSAAPGAEEVISYQIPTYKLNGPLVHFAVHKDHCSFIVTDQTLIEKFSRELTGFKTSGTTIHFTADKQLPVSLITRIVKARVNENIQKTPLKKSKSKK